MTAPQPDFPPLGLASDANADSLTKVLAMSLLVRFPDAVSCVDYIVASPLDLRSAAAEAANAAGLGRRALGFEVCGSPHGDAAAWRAVEGSPLGAASSLADAALAWQRARAAAPTARNRPGLPTRLASPYP